MKFHWDLGEYEVCGQFGCVDRFFVYPELDGSDQEFGIPELFGPEICLAMRVAQEHGRVRFANHYLVVAPEEPEPPELKLRGGSRCAPFLDIPLETRPLA